MDGELIGKRQDSQESPAESGRPRSRELLVCARAHKVEIVTTAEIVREIERLPSSEKAEVLSVLLRSQAKNSKLSPEELVALADQMIAAQEPEEADRLEAKILAGFYGT